MGEKHYKQKLCKTMKHANFVSISFIKELLKSLYVILAHNVCSEDSCPLFGLPAMSLAHPNRPKYFQPVKKKNNKKNGLQI